MQPEREYSSVLHSKGSGMIADLDGEDGPGTPHGHDPMHDNPPLPADLIRAVSPGPQPLPAKKASRGRISAGVLSGILVGLLVGVLVPPVNQVVHNVADRTHSYFYGVNHPIELSPLCKYLGGIVAPPAERDAAYQYRCAHSQRAISRNQIRLRCISQWGPSARLVLLDPNSASGWTCHTPGILH
jgi:hypothetical protein